MTEVLWKCPWKEKSHTRTHKTLGESVKIRWGTDKHSRNDISELKTKQDRVFPHGVPPIWNLRTHRISGPTPNSLSQKLRRAQESVLTTATQVTGWYEVSSSILLCGAYFSPYSCAKSFSPMLNYGWKQNLPQKKDTELTNNRKHSFALGVGVMAEH